MKLFKLFRYQLIICSVVLLLAACHEEPAPAPVLPVNRTVLVYMVASNNLGTGRFDEADLAEMQQAAKAGDITDGRLLVYHVPPSGDPVLKEVTASGIDTLAMYDSETSSVSSVRMRAVFDDMRRVAPADEYGLVLWSHASGWLQDGIDDELDNAGEMVAPLAFGFDKGQKMNLTTLARTLQGQNFGFVYFDCCYMGSVEVAYELRHATPLIVGSPSELPSNGMPYNRNIRCFFAPEADLLTAARNTFELYDGEFGANRTCTMSVINTAALDGLAAVVRDIYSGASDPWPAGYEPQRYMTESRCYHFDLGHYVEALGSDDALLAEFRRFMDEAVLYEAATPFLWNRLAVESHCGLTTYIFENEAQSRIKGYDTTSWFSDVASELLTD